MELLSLNPRKQDKEEVSIRNTPLPLVIKLKKEAEGRVSELLHCGTELIWGADHDIEDLNDGEESEYDFFSNFSCPKCHSYVEVFHYNGPIEDDEV